MKIYLVRHGQSRWQVERDDYDFDSPLTELGQKQARSLGHWLANGAELDNGYRLELSALFTSPYRRALETAEAISRPLGLPIQMDDNLKEADFLVSAHLPRADYPGQPYPDQAETADYAAFKSQASLALGRLVSTAKDVDGPVMAISHGGLISTLLRVATGSDTVSFWIYNTSVHLIEWKRGRWHLVYLNLWDHLPPDLRTF